MDLYILPNVKQIASGKKQHSTGRGWEGDARGRAYGDICIHIADSLCYKAETNTPL